MDSVETYYACARQDPEAYTRLFEYLYRLALRYFWDLPAAEDLAQDCAQEALIRIHDRLAECRTPEAFLGWARRIAGNLAIDELRRSKRLVAVDHLDEGYPGDVERIGAPDGIGLIRADPNSMDPTGVAVEARVQIARLRRLLGHAPMSERSRRVVVGRFLDAIPDEDLARIESDLDGATVLPSHIQVTRTKDLARLREFRPLIDYLAAASDALLES